MTNEENDPVARLIRLAGPGTPLEPERRARLEAGFRSAWHGHLVHRTRRRRLRWTLAGAAVAAAVAAIVLDRQPAGTAPVAADAGLPVARVEGSPMRLRGERSVRLQAGDRLRSGDRLLTGAGRLALGGDGGASIRFDRHSDVTFAGDSFAGDSFAGDSFAGDSFAGVTELELRSGAVYSDSGDGRGRLRVVTSAGSIVEIGTRFQVRVDAGSVEVDVRSGRVAVERGDARWVAGAGEALVMGSDPRREEPPDRRSLDPAAPAWAWTQEISPSFSLEGKSLSEYLEWIERETGREVRFAAADLAAEASTVVLHGDLTGIRPDQTLEVVMPSVGWTWTADEDALVLSPEAAP